jgi:DNA-binding MarR family transcriptional regulator
MREDHVRLQPHAPPGAVPEVGHVLELLEDAWEQGRDILSTAPVSSTQIRVLYIIERAPGINLSTLRRRLSVGAPSATRLCDRLQAAGFLRRTPRPDDRRETQLQLTDAGATHLREIRRRREQALRRTMSRMSPAARDALTTGLAAFCEAVAEEDPRSAGLPHR